MDARDKYIYAACTRGWSVTVDDMQRRESGRATEVAVAVAGYIVNQTRGLATAGLEGSVWRGRMSATEHHRIGGSIR